MKTIQNVLKSPAAALAGLFVLFIIAYLPVLTSGFAYHDDFYFWSGDKSGPCSNYTIFSVSAELGRYVLAFSACGVWRLVDTFQDMAILRFLSICLITLTAFGTYLWLSRHNVGNIQAFLLAVAFFTLPTFQSDSAYGLNIFLLAGGVISCAATCLAWQALFGGKEMRYAAAMLGASAALFLVTLHIHPATLLFGWFFFAIPLLQRRGREWLAALPKTGVFFLLMMGSQALFFILYRYVYINPISVAYSGGISGARDISGKVDWFVNGPLIDGLNYWNIFPSAEVAALTGFLILAGFVCDGVNSAGRMREDGAPGAWRVVLTKTVVMIALPLLALLPYIVVRSSTLCFYRGLRGFGPLLLLLTYNGLASAASLAFSKEMASKVLAAIAAVSAVVGVAFAHHNVEQYIVRPQVAELSFIRDRLADISLDPVGQIHVIRNMPEVPLYSEQIRYDEFGTSATSYYPDVLNIMRAVLREMGQEPALSHLEITHGFNDIIPRNAPVLYVIDMRRMPIPPVAGGLLR